MSEPPPLRSPDFDRNKFLDLLISPESFSGNDLVPNKNQVAGHAGFFKIKDQPELCLKPFNVRCVRGRREHLFYQFIEYFKRSNQHQYVQQTHDEIIKTNFVEFRGDDDANQTTESSQFVEEDLNQYYYSYFKLLTHPARKCECPVNSALFKSLSPYVANFNHVKLLKNQSCDTQSTKSEDLEQSEQAASNLENFKISVYSDETTCPCYGLDPIEKTACARDYKKINFLCLEDLTSHCHEPCILDIKIGRITYDPIAVKEKVLEQSTKYMRLREFGFRILGMKLGDQIKDKTFGKSLETDAQVLKALGSYFDPLKNPKDKLATIGKILARLRGLLHWFETQNIGQLKFFSSSILIVYDSYKNTSTNSFKIEDLTDGVRVSMIDFAHVFHVHHNKSSLKQPSQPYNRSETKVIERDENYIFGLRKLISFFGRLELQSTNAQ